jgi:hypothetical protein
MAVTVTCTFAGLTELIVGFLETILVLLASCLRILRSSRFSASLSTRALRRALATALAKALPILLLQDRVCVSWAYERRGRR